MIESYNIRFYKLWKAWVLDKDAGNTNLDLVQYFIKNA